jgi:L-rhamnose mutarotase
MMSVKRVAPLFLVCFIAALLLSGCSESLKSKPPKRVGMVVGLHSEMLDEYKSVHANDHPGVRDLLNKYHLHNFSIFLHQIEGKWYEFGYYEYTGNDFEGDMARMDAEPRTIEWLKQCDPMQLPLPGETSWAVMEQVYYNK